MSTLRISRLLYRMSLVAIACVLLPVACHAVPMRVSVGFDGVAKGGVWTPIAVELANPSEDAIEGTLHITQRDYGQSSIPVCSANVNLPPESDKLYYVYARLQEYGDVTVLLTSGNRMLARKKASSNIVSRDARLVVTIGKRASRLNFLNGEAVAVPGSPSPGTTLQVGSIESAELPDRPAAYEGVDVLVVSDLSPSAVNPNALKALSMWVASGGTLVVSTGPNYRTYRDPFYDELLPVRLTGATSLTRFGPLVGLGKCAFPAGSMAVASSSVKPQVCSSVLSESGVPILAERQYGAGKVIYLAFDHLSSPFRDWDGQTEFWKAIVLAAEDTRSLVETSRPDDPYAYSGGPYAPSSGQPDFAQVVEQNPSIKAPSFSTISLFLLAYLIVLVPANYFVLHKKRKRELAWVTTPAIVLLFTAGAYGIGYTMKGGSLQLAQAMFVEGSSNSRYARTISAATVFSPASRTYRVEAADRYSLGRVIPLGNDEQIPNAQLGEQLVFDGIRMAMWSSKTFESVSGVDLGGCLTANLMLNGKRIQGEVRNDTNADLRECVIICGGMRKSIGNLGRGCSVAVDMGTTSVSAGTGQLRFGNKDSLDTRFRQFARQAAESAGTPILLARSADRPGVFSLPRQRASVSSCTYYAFRLDYGMGSSFSLSPGAIPGRVTASENVSTSGLTFPDKSITADMSPGGYMIVSYRLPISTSSKVTMLKVVESHVEDSVPGSYGMTPPGLPAAPPGPPPSPPVVSPGPWTPSGSPVPLSVYNAGTGRWDRVVRNRSIRNPGHYVATPGVVKVKVKNNRHNAIHVNIGIAIEGRRG